MAIKITKKIWQMNHLENVLQQIKSRAEVVQTNMRAALKLRGTGLLCNHLVQRLEPHENSLDFIIHELLNASADLRTRLTEDYETKPLEALFAKLSTWEVACFINRLSEDVEAHYALLRSTLSFSSDATIRQINHWASNGMQHFTGLQPPLEPIVTMRDCHKYTSYEWCRCSDCRKENIIVDDVNAFTPKPCKPSLRRVGIIEPTAGFVAEPDHIPGPSHPPGPSHDTVADDPVPGTSKTKQVAKKSMGSGKSLMRFAVENSVPRVVPRVVRDADENDDSNDSSIVVLEEVNREQEADDLNRTIELSGDSGNEDAMEVNQEDVVSLASGEEADVFNDDGTIDTVWK